MYSEDSESLNYHTVAALLVDVREAQEVSREAVSSMLNLRMHTIVALETGDYDALPGDAYIRGYLKNYAELLGLDTEAVLALYDEESSGKPRAQKVFIPEPMLEGYRPGPAMILLSLVMTVTVYIASLMWLTLPQERFVWEVPPVNDGVLAPKYE